MIKQTQFQLMKIWKRIQKLQKWLKQPIKCLLLLWTETEASKVNMVGF